MHGHFIPDGLFPTRKSFAFQLAQMEEQLKKWEAERTNEAAVAGPVDAGWSQEISVCECTMHNAEMARQAALCESLSVEIERQKELLNSKTDEIERLSGRMVRGLHIFMSDCD